MDLNNVIQMFWENNIGYAFPGILYVYTKIKASTNSFPT